MYSTTIIKGSMCSRLERMVADDYKFIILVDKRPAGEHERRLKAPQVNEVAVVIADNKYSIRDILIQRRSNELQYC